MNKFILQKSFICVGLQSIYLLCTSNIYQIKTYFSIIVFCIMHLFAIAQSPTLQGVVGASMQLGSHTQRIGIRLGAWVFNSSVQINALCNAFYQRKSIGAPGNSWEIQIGTTAIAAFGNTIDRYANPSFYNDVFCAINKNYKISYTYKWYLDTRGTSQPTGTIGLHAQRFCLTVQNDGFAFNSFDQYRTGTFQLHYTDSLVNVGTNIVLWTGNTKNAVFVADKSAKTGSLDISKNKFGKYSAGLAFVSVGYALPYQQSAFVHLGVDDERVRNLFQNTLIHNSGMLHKVIPKINNLQIPMLDTMGYPYFNASQVIKKPKLYWQLGLNEVICY
jgi:Bacterial toxin 23